jgi:tetratricopeptide (TPR) repeat protein
VGDNAARRNAYPEAIVALRKRLALLATLPDNPEQTRHELMLQLILGELLMAAKGMASPEAGDAYARAHALCHQMEETPQLFRVLLGLFVFQSAQGRLRIGEALGQQLFDLAQLQHDPVLLVEGHLAVGVIALFRGDLVVARTHLEQSLELSAAQQLATPLFGWGYHPRIAGLTWILRPLWGLGYADQAQQRCQEALALAQQLEHTPSLAYAELSAAILSHCRRDVASTQAHAEALMALAGAHAARVGPGHAGRRGCRCGAYLSGVGGVSRGGTGDPAPPLAGLTVLSEALTLVATMEARWWEAELSRLRGELLLLYPRPEVP